MKKNGQFEISFGMLFSIILIIAFIAVAIYATMFFLGFGKCTDVGLFKQYLQEDIDKAWKSDENNFVFSNELAKEISHVCFADFSQQGRGEFKDIYEEAKRGVKENYNIFFWPYKSGCKDIRGFEMLHLDIKDITKTNNP
ncbi:MAG: hypothetical protein AABX65_03370, partial [Nanoarchaeota archaeon]